MIDIRRIGFDGQLRGEMRVRDSGFGGGHCQHLRTGFHFQSIHQGFLLSQI
jgi:hypothetical protein